MKKKATLTEPVVVKVEKELKARLAKLDAQNVNVPELIRIAIRKEVEMVEQQQAG